MDVAVDEDCTITVAMTPNIKPARGLARILLSNNLLALAPATNLKPVVISSNEIMKKYKQHNNPNNLNPKKRTDLTFLLVVRSICLE